ncbi:MAG: hypothetical protein JJE49_03075 [Peptostreptococcaceae bacterium]|nr:hypothetical protein [Peptostreptococcaceae bacterium]
MKKLLLLTFAIISVCIFVDARESNNSLASSFFWAVIALFFFPPIGIGIFSHRLNQKSQLSKNKKSSDFYVNLYVFL